MINTIRRMASCLVVLVVSACTTNIVPERFDIAYIEQNPTPRHLRYMSDSGNLSTPVYIPKRSVGGGQHTHYTPSKPLYKDSLASTGRVGYGEP